MSSNETLNSSMSEGVNIFADVRMESLYLTLSLSCVSLLWTILSYVIFTKFCGYSSLWTKAIRPCLFKCLKRWASFHGKCCIKCCSPACSKCCSCCVDCCTTNCAKTCGKSFGQEYEESCGTCCLSCCGETRSYESKGEKEKGKSCSDKFFDFWSGQRLSYAISIVHGGVLKGLYILLTLYYFSFVNLPSLSRNGTNETNTVDIGVGPINNFTDLRRVGENVANTITFYYIIAELVVLALGGVGGWGIIISTCCHQKHEKCDGRVISTDWRGLNQNPDIAGCYIHAYEFLRTLDLFNAAIIAPVAHVQMFYLGGALYAIIAARTIFHGLTFAAVAIAGVRFVVCFCVVSWECSIGVESENVKIRNIKHLLLDVGIKLISITLKITTASSALATYLTIGILVRSQAFRIAYFSFTVIRGATAMLSMIFTAVLLRWEVLEEDEKKTEKCIIKVLRFLNKYEPHATIAFIIDVSAYCGLIVLNSMIVLGQQHVI